MHKQEFISIIVKLQEQLDHDLEYVKKLCNVFGSNFCDPYNNQNLFDVITRQLASNFKHDLKAKELINEFMYDYDFGRSKNSYIDSADTLWNMLIKKCELKK